MLEPGTTNRSLLWRFLPWLVPIGLIVVGLMFVTAGLTDSERELGPERDVAPANVTALFEADAPGWAVTQVGPAVTTAVAEVVMVSATATGASTYSARAVIIRQDAIARAPTAGGTLPTLAEADTSTVATCVLWDVDVTNRVSTPLAALEIAREVGLHDLAAEASSLRARCRDANLG